jgi:predicted homoserine dehydrogenase-like protein
MELIKSLNEYAASGRTIKVGLVGAGQMGEGLACQMELMTGMRAFAVADVVPGRPEAVLKSMRVEKKDYVLTDDLATASQAVRDGKHVGTSDAGILSRIPDLDIIVEATGIPEIGAQIAYEAILNRKHVLQMNVETDATVGYILRKMARPPG